MKNLFLTLVGLGLAGIFFSSCQQQEDTLKAQDEIITDNTELIDLRVAESPILTIWHDNGVYPGKDGKDYGCWDEGGNCLPEVIVTPKHPEEETEEEINTLVNFIGKNKSDSVKESLLKNKDYFSTILGEATLRAVISGKATLQTRGTFEKQEISYILVYSNGKLHHVIPIRIR